MAASVVRVETNSHEVKLVSATPDADLVVFGILAIRDGVSEAPLCPRCGGRGRIEVASGCECCPDYEATCPRCAGRKVDYSVVCRVLAEQVGRRDYRVYLHASATLLVCCDQLVAEALATRWLSRELDVVLSASNGDRRKLVASGALCYWKRVLQGDSPILETARKCLADVSPVLFSDTWLREGW